MVKSSLKAGNYNLKGKKSVTLSCGCCDAVNLNERELKVFHQQAIDEAALDHYEGRLND